MKLFKIFAVTLAATMMFSCVGDKVEKQPEGESSIVLKVSTLFGSRANVDEVADGYETPINTGYVFFTADADVYLAGAINSSEIVSAEGQKFTVPSEATNIYVFGNTPSGFNGTDFVGDDRLTDLLNEAFAISTQNASATGNGLGDIFMYGTAVIDYSNKVTIGTSEVIQVEIDLVPSAARIEFEGIGLKAGSVITEYTIENVYLDYFYPEFTGVGTAAGDMIMSPTAGELTGRTGYDWAKDAIAQLVNTPSLGNADHTAGTGKVWAYQVAPEATPRIIIQLSDISYKPNDTDPAEILAGDRFVTVSGWNDDQNVLISAFVKGNVYHAENILFDFDDLTRNPNPGDIDLYVTVTSTPWVINLVTPVI